MLRRTPIFRALDRQLVSSGLQPDVHSLTKVLWEAAENVCFYSGKVVGRKLPAAMLDLKVADFGSLSTFAIGLSQQRDNNGVRWVWVADRRSAGQPNIYRWYGPTAEFIYTLPSSVADETSIAPATYVDFTHYGDWTIINNSIDTPVIYKPAGPTVTDFGEDLITGAVQLLKKLSFVMAFGTGPRGTGVKWSDGSDIEVWTPDAENSAGGLTIDDFDTRIRAAVRLGSAVAVFAEDQMALVSYISLPYYFGQKVVLDGIGAVGKNAVCSDGASVYGVGRNGIWWTDSNTYRYIDEGFLHDYLQANVNWAQKSKIYAVRNDFTGCFEFFFPMGASTVISEGWSYDPRTGGWSPVPVATLKTERRLFEAPLIGDSTGNVLLDQRGTTSNALLLRTKPLSMQLQSPDGLSDTHMDCRVDEIELLVKDAQSVQFAIGASQFINGPYVWDVWRNITSDSKTYKTTEQLPDGVYHKLQFQSTASDWRLDLQGFILFGQNDGTKRD